MTRTMLTLHRWLGLVAGVMILIAAFTAIGLNHQDAWRRTPQAAAASSPFQKYVLSTAVDPSDSRRVLVGTADGLFRSLDGGSTWEEAVLPVPAEQVGTILFDPGRAGVVYLALRSIGVFRSEDHGDIWEELILPFYPPEGTQVAGLSLDGEGRLSIASTDGLYRQASPAGVWERVGKAAARPEDGKGFTQLVYDLHDGRFWGTYGVPVTDAVSVALIGLVLSGYLLYFGRLVRVRLGRLRAARLARDKAREPLVSP
ncbi:MAG TPA: PepSY domain-containing protein [Pantanalinema sp.]